MTLTILKIIAVVVILVAMLVILLGIGHMTSGNFETNREDIDELRHDVESKRDVVSNKNIFHEFVEGKEVLKEVPIKKR